MTHYNFITQKTLSVISESRRRETFSPTQHEQLCQWKGEYPAGKGETSNQLKVETASDVSAR